MADIVLKLVEAGKNLFTYLTWARLALLVGLMVLVAACIAFWDNRPLIYKTISAGKYSGELIPELSQTTKDAIQTVVDKQKNILAIQIVETDFRSNARDTKFFYSEASELTYEYNLQRKTRAGLSPLFLGGDTSANDRLISIIEQEFVCNPPPPRLVELIPSMPKYVKQVCSISIPPVAGKMVGYINVWLVEPIDRAQVPIYKNISRQLADEVYYRDVMHTLTD